MKGLMTIPAVLPRSLNFQMLILGRSGSGKSTLLMSLLTRRKSPFRRKFDKVFVWCPSLDSMDDCPFDKLPQNQVFDGLTTENLDQVLSDITESGEKVLFVWDDVNNQMKEDRDLEQMLATVSHNRRHLAGKGGSVSLIMTAQVYNKVPKAIRKNSSQLIFFQPSRAELDNIFIENALIPRKQFDAIVKHVFKSKRDFMYMNLMKGPEEMYHRNWNRLQLSSR